MSTERHQRIYDLFRAACERPPDERSSYMDQACGDDHAMRVELQRLVELDDADDSLAMRRNLAVVDAFAAAISDSRSGVLSANLPECIAGYRIIRLLGRGGMGLVYLAEQVAPRRIVALKILSPELSTPQMLSRFALEADALGRLQHPQIAQIYETGVAELAQGSHPYLAMEYVEGKTLLEHANAYDLDDTARLNLLTQLCEAVHHAHQKGVIHRDLKPANILVTEDNQLKVLDFGVARLTDADVKSTTLRTSIGELIGTIPYMSPEQASGNARDLDTRSDVYALGVVGYELLSGRLPYDLAQRLIHEAVQMVQHQAPMRLSAITPRLRGDVETIIGKALEKEPARRYQSAWEMAEDIRRFLDDQPILARPPSVIYQLKKFARRNSLLVGSGVAILAVLLAGVIGMSLLSVQLARQRDAADRSRLEAETAQRRAEVAHRETEVALQEADQARHVAEQSLVVQSAISGFLQDVFGFGSPYVGKADMTVADALNFAAARVDEKLAHVPKAAMEVRVRLSDTYYSLGELNKSIEQLQRALRDAESSDETDPGSLAMVHASLGQAYIQAGRPEEAKEHLEQAMTLSNLPALREHPSRALAMTNYGALMISQQEFEAAIPILREALDLRLKEHGSDHPYTMTVRNNLAVAVSRTGRWDEAEPLSRENMECHLRVVGEKHPNTITGIYNYADLLRELGRLEEAEAHFQRCLALGKLHLPARHFLVGLYHSGYGELLRVAGRFDEALTEQTLGHKILHEQLGSEHPQTQRARERMARIDADRERSSTADTVRSETH